MSQEKKMKVRHKTVQTNFIYKITLFLIWYRNRLLAYAVNLIELFCQMPFHNVGIVHQFEFMLSSFISRLEILSTVELCLAILFCSSDINVTAINLNLSCLYFSTYFVQSSVNFSPIVVTAVYFPFVTLINYKFSVLFFWWPTDSVMLLNVEIWREIWYRFNIIFTECHKIRPTY
jgi:hypothetical protein